MLSSVHGKWCENPRSDKNPKTTKWLYLEPILSNDEGELGVKFRRVDQGFRQVTRILESDPRLSALLQSSRLQSMLDSISEQLLSCQSALNQYIDEKRSTFPRLYFLSDDDLLELLGQARAGAEGRAAVMQTHLKKLFPGTTGVRLGPGDMSITALCSHYGETFQLDHPVDIDCPVEVWLKSLETEMRSSLKNMALKCVVTNSLQEQDPFSLPTQILCLAQNIRFTEQAERAINSKGLHKLKGDIEKENSYYADAEVEDESERQKKQALILQCAYYTSVIRILIEHNVTSTSDWLWQKQLRFYLLGSKEVVAKMGLAQISYSYEYLGVNTGQFVRTELADDCFLILTQSLHLGFVGNPFGPAGTGKTESVKALGGLVGRLVLIFNCDEAMDAECMGRLLTGLARCGAWGCFDEFNRLPGAALAAAAHQLAALLAALLAAAPTALLNGKHVTVSEWCGVAATMNPAGRGYGGRRALPAALERVLRPVALRAPRGERLAASLLAARCVPHAGDLARDLHNVFAMASALLSSQRHYDWGLRALKAAVGSCGAALSAPRAPHAAPRPPRALARRVLALNNMSKLTTHDAERFENILSLVFSDVPVEESDTDPINLALETSLEKLKLVHNKLQIQKCVELYEQLQQRMGVVIVGPPGSGKSTIRKLLKAALVQQGKNIVEYIICPKAMSRDWLLGHIDPDTRQWTDGVISTTALEISNQPSDVWSWVVCDGDIDPEWIEALNSVLDDNRLLTLPSGWRIQFGSNVNFIFETHSLEHASPATVSRMGIILLSDDVSCDLEVLESWMQKADFESETVKMALPLLQQALKKMIHWLTAHKSEMILKMYNITMIKQILTQFEYIVQNIAADSSQITPEEIVYTAVERSVVDILKESAVHSFHDELSGVVGPPPPSPLPTAQWASDALYMSARLAAAEHAARASLTAPHAHLLIVGPDACAKNIMAEYILKECNAVYITIDCTPILEPSDIIAELKRNNVVRSGGGSSPNSNSPVTVFVRALHRAHVDAWGSSPVHSFLLQLIQHNGFWTRCAEEGGAAGAGCAGAQWCGAARVRVLATARPAAALAPRLAAALAHCVLQEPDDEELLELATNYLKLNIDKSIPLNEVSGLAGKVLAMFKEVVSTFHSQMHYKWNASHLKRWCENIKWYSPTTLENLVSAICAEANFIFRDRLVTDGEKAKFNTISRTYFKQLNDSTYFISKLRNDGVYLEAVDQVQWYQRMQKLINQCLSEQEYNVFGENGAEVCSELAILCPAMERACNGEVVVCVCAAGAGRRAAALLAAAALPAALFFINHYAHFNTQFKNALSAASEGTRALVVGSEWACGAAALARVEALRRAHSPHAAPAHLVPALAAPHLFHDIKQNLGIVIFLDKDQNDLSELMEKYPFLYNEAHLLWLDHWSDATLREMPHLIIERLLKEDVADTSKDQLDTIPVEGFVQIHKSVEAAWARAPCRYVNFIKTYYRIVTKKKTAIQKRHGMLTAGVEALRRARSEVATLQEEAKEQEAELSDKQAKAAQALNQISATVRATTDKKEEMHELKKNIEIENEKLQVQKKEIEAELASVEPVIAAARAAVGDIRPESLSEVRSLRAPPDVVRDILEGVLRLMGIADTSWHSMKNFLSKRGVKEDIRCLDASQISPQAAQGVQRLLERRGASFEAGAARRASAACAPLAAWVRANLAYATALARVQPLQRQQAQLQRNLEEAESQVAALSSGLATVEARVGALSEQLGRHSREAAALELRARAAAAALAAARRLLHHLKDEYAAWEADLENISKEISELNMRSLMAAAYIVYLPDLTEPQARDYIKKWSALVGFDDSSFSIINFLSTTEKQLKWDADGLPSDKSAIKNAVLIDQVLEPQKCGFTPLIVDPDGEGIAWLKNTLADVQCDFISHNSDKLLTAVQYAVRLGRVLVITDIEGVHESWAPLLYGLPLATHATHAAATARLVLHCRDGRLPARLSPPHAARLAPLHFTASLDGLTDQLVHYALEQQNPEVNAKSKEMKLKKATLQKQQHELQENLLRDLSSNVDILHDANLLESLNKMRATNTTITEALEAALAVERASDAACEAYAASARRAAGLALAVKRLATRRPLIALPVDAVLDMYVDAVRTAGVQTPINNDEVVRYLTRRIIERVLLGLHKKDKYIVVLHLLKEVYHELIPDMYWQFLIGNYDLIEDPNNINEIKSNYPWIPGDCIKRISNLKPISEDLFNKLSLNNEDLWKKFLLSGELNDIATLQLTAFETIVAIAALRPDSLYRAFVAFIDQVLGAGAISSGEAIPRAVRASRGRAARPPRAPRPVLLLAAHGADVLAAHAHALTQVGIEEGRNAWEAAVGTTRGGGWVALIVGASPFTPELHAFLAAFVDTPGEEFNEEFRLWIISEDREIPSLISNACINVILEAPEGVKNNIMNTLSAWGNYEADAKTVRLHACLALFHALVQERRAYIPQGWSRWYAWEWGEVSACAGVLRAGAGGAGGGAARALCLALYAARAGGAGGGGGAEGAGGADAQLLAALHRLWLADAALAPQWRPPSLPVQLPYATQLQAYTTAFNSMPDIDSPQLLGLPANCRVAWEKNAASDIVTGLKELNSTISASQKRDSVSPLKSILALWKKLMSGSPLIKSEYEVKTRECGWWGSVCACEAREAAQAARVLHASLAHRARSLAHTHTHALHKVPEEWQLLWAGPDAPHTYLKEFCHRARAAVARVDTGPITNPDYMPAEVDLRGLVRPARAVWALRARTAARLACAPDALALRVRWDCAADEKCSDGLVVAGLALCGAVWRRGAGGGAGALAAAAPRDPPLAPAPPLLLRYLPHHEHGAVTSDGTIEVPVYSSETREEVVFNARAPLSRSFDYDTAVLNAIALFIAPVD